MATDQYQAITDRIVTALESAGSWEKPWRSLGIVGVPVNGVTGRPYRGINVWLLALASFGDCRWYTFKQAQAKGGSVKKGEKGTQIVFFKFIEKMGDDGKVSKVCLLRNYTVFCHTQTTLADQEPSRVVPVVEPATRYASALTTLSTLGVKVNHGGDRAYYSPSTDSITLPYPDQFKSEETYVSTFAHEVLHSTAHPTRLHRELGKKYGDSTYAFEELVAELGAAFLCGTFGISSEIENHTSYLASWLKILKSDSRAIFAAAKKAQEAADFILGAADGVEAADEEVA